MQPDGVVALDPGGDGRLGLVSRGKAVAMDELAFQARPERLGDGVVEARSDASCGLEDAQSPQYTAL